MRSITSRIDAITGISDDYMSDNIPAPKSVKIELTGRCNFSCAFCARSQNLRKVEDIDKDFFKRILKEMRDEGVEEIGLFYLGESMMVPWLPEAIKYAKDIGFPYIFLTTNGSLATPDKVRKCMEAGLNSLKFSFNYADSAQLKEIAGVKESYFERIKNNIKSARIIRDVNEYDCGLYASFIEYDGDQRDKMMKAVEEIQPFLDEVYGLPLYNQATLVSEEEKAMNPDDLDIGFKVLKLDSSNLRKWQVDEDNLEASLFDSIENFVEGYRSSSLSINSRNLSGFSSMTLKTEGETMVENIFRTCFFFRAICMKRTTITVI